MKHSELLSAPLGRLRRVCDDGNVSAREHYFRIGERVVSHISLLHLRDLRIGVFDSLDIDGDKIGGQILFKFVGLLVPCTPP